MFEPRVSNAVPPAFPRRLISRLFFLFSSYLPTRQRTTRRLFHLLRSYRNPKKQTMVYWTSVVAAVAFSSLASAAVVRVDPYNLPQTTEKGQTG